MNKPENSIDIDRVTELLTELADELPDTIYENLNLGILVSEEVKLSPGSSPSQPLYILGEYLRSTMGRQIILYYGSFMEVYQHLEEPALRKKLRQTLHHELLHHLEGQGGEFGLEFEDYLNMQRYKQGLKKRQQRE